MCTSKNFNINFNIARDISKCRAMIFKVENIKILFKKHEKIGTPQIFHLTTEFIEADKINE